MVAIVYVGMALGRLVSPWGCGGVYVSACSMSNILMSTIATYNIFGFFSTTYHIFGVQVSSIDNDMRGITVFAGGNLGS